ncbi:HAD family phosphatase [Streptomyces sp. NPDC093681]|uniref:HAD family hydrolase n=1 Tax=Streptomyces TaxID=1883 RepID=UPI0016491BDE|nr:HAD family phosphatase [Streptomyces salinarius]
MTTLDHALLDWSLEAVVFDCDGTLMDSERHWQEARGRAFREHGLQPPPGFAEQALGLHYEDCGRLMAQSVHKPELAEDLTAALLDHFLALVTEEPVTMPGAVRLVRLLSGRLPLAVASNCPRVVVEGSLERAGLLAYFRHLVVPDTGDRVRPKPHPDVYAVAARLCGVPPRRALAVEDSLTGVEAARRASLRVLGVGPRPQGEGATRADAWLPSLDAPELLAWAHVLGSPRGPRTP